MGKEVKVVLDTNVWISIFMKKTLSRDFSKIFKQEKIKILVSEAILKELSRVLTYPKITKIFEDAGISMKEVLENVIKNSIVIKPTLKLHVVRGDEADNRVLECAYQAKANFIVSGNKHLLKLRRFKDVRIITPREFLSSLK
jgi:hypothetical protein